MTNPFDQTIAAKAKSSFDGPVLISRITSVSISLCIAEQAKVFLGITYVVSAKLV
jgi:hypothetical protein